MPEEADERDAAVLALRVLHEVLPVLRGESERLRAFVVKVAALQQRYYDGYYGRGERSGWGYDDDEIEALVAEARALTPPATNSPTSSRDTTRTRKGAKAKAAKTKAPAKAGQA